jgi:hypothetical protein
METSFVYLSGIVWCTKQKFKNLVILSSLCPYKTESVFTAFPCLLQNWKSTVQ